MAARSRFISVISQAAVVLAVAGATATVSASPLSPLHKKESISYEFTFVNGTTVAGTATSNTAYLAAAGGTDPAKPIGMNVHVSCSDPFTGGWGTKDGPSQTRDSAWQIASYTITKGSKTCGGQVGPVTPKIPKIDIEMLVNGDDADTPTGPSVTVPGTATITYIVTNNGAKPLRSVSVVDDKVGAITCPKTALAVGESMTCTSRTASVTSAGQQSASATVSGIADGEPASAPAPADKQVSYSFIFVNGKTVTGTATSNTAFLAAAGGTDPAKPIGMNVHVSCSDPFTGGWGKKDGPSQMRDSAWQIASYQIRKADKKGEKVCGQTFSPTTQTVTDTDPVHYLGTVAPPQPAALGDVVWHDLDGDGIQDAGEPGIADAWVTLLNLDGTMPTDLSGNPLGSRYTKADGLYLFANLKAGTYRLYVSLDCSWQATTANAGADDAKDSDTTYFRPDNGRCLTRTEPITVTAGTTNLTIDAGYTRSF